MASELDEQAARQPLDIDRRSYTQLQNSSSAEEELVELTTVAGSEQRTLQLKAPLLLRASLALGLVVAIAAAAVLTRSGRHLRSTPAAELELTVEAAVTPGAAPASKVTWSSPWPSLCGRMDIDKEYVDATPGGWGVNYDHIPTPEMCCAMCQGEPRCKAFTWVKDAGLDGCPSQCWLKGSVGTAQPKVGVVSGVPPPRPNLPPVPLGANGPGGTLYCFSLAVPTSYEPKMLQWQHTHKVSIFACDGFDVYSNKAIAIAQGVVAKVVDSDLKCEYGGDSGTALNAWIFIAVWKKVIDDASYSHFDWVVKVDPDCVFFPDRLGLILRGVEKKGYINNCQYGMHGPIEVFSSSAVSILGADYKASWDGKAPKRCVKKQDFGLWGEDMFLDQCLGKILEVKPRPLFPQLMCEAHCDCPAWYWCQNGTQRVSYHPFKTVESYANCMANALGGKPGGPTTSFAAVPVLTVAPVAQASTTSAPMALNSSRSPVLKSPTLPATPSGHCKDAVTEGGSPVHGMAECSKAVKWAKEHGVYEHPEWYKDAKLTAGSGYAGFQRYLHSEGKNDCPAPCAAVTTAVAAAAAPAAALAATDGPHYPPGPRAQTFYMYRAQSEASYPLENSNTADLGGVMWYLHNEVVSNTPRKYHIDRIRRFKVTVKNTWEFWNAHKRQFGAFMAYDAARCSTPVCAKVYRQYGFIVGCQVCDVTVAAYLAKGQTNWNCKKGDKMCNAPLWYSLPGPCPSMGMSNSEIKPNQVGLDVNKAKTPDCLKRMPGGHCDKATGAPDCTYSYEEAGVVLLNELVGIDDYNHFWNRSFTQCMDDVSQGKLPADTHCVHKKEYVPELDKGVGTSFWDSIHDEERCTARMNAVRRLFKQKFPQFPETLPEPACEFDMYYDGEFDWKVNHTGAAHSDYWDNMMH